MSFQVLSLFKTNFLSQIFIKGNNKTIPLNSLQLQKHLSREFQIRASSENYNLRPSIDPKAISHKWDKPETRLPYKFQEHDIKRLQNLCGPVSPCVIIGRFPLTITPGDLFRLNQTNSTFQNDIEDYYFERFKTLEFNGFCHIKFSKTEAAMQLCFDIFNISGLIGGKTVMPKFENRDRYLLFKSNSISQDGGAGSSVFISGLPALTTASDLVSWMAPYRIPLAFDDNINLAVKPINHLNTVRKSSRPVFSGKPNHKQFSSSTFLVRLASPSEAHHMVSLLHNSIFKPSEFGNRYPVSVKILY